MVPGLLALLILLPSSPQTPPDTNPAPPPLPRSPRPALAAAPEPSPADSLPEELVGGRTHGIGYERISDAFRYDRVQGYSLGLGYRVRLPALAFADLQGTVRYGFSDDRVTGRLSVIYEAPWGRVVASGYRDVVDVDPISPGQTVSNTLNAIFAAHDDGDYGLATGGGVAAEIALGGGLDLRIAARLEQEDSVIRRAKSAVNDLLGGDGEFPENGPLDQGRFFGASAMLVGAGFPVGWWLALDGLTGRGTATGRAYGAIQASAGERRGATLQLKAGVATSPVLRQMEFRLGGIRTVRGFDYGTARGQAFWAAQLDLAPLPGRIRPVAFVDVGQAGPAGDLFGARALVGAGAGLSIYNGALRLELSRRLSPSVATLRFDLVVAAVR